MKNIITLAFAFAFALGVLLPTPDLPPSPCAQAIIAAQDVALEGDPAYAPPVNAVLSADEAARACRGEHVPNVTVDHWEDGSVTWEVSNLEGGITFYGATHVDW